METRIAGHTTLLSLYLRYVDAETLTVQETLRHLSLRFWRGIILLLLVKSSDVVIFR